MKGVPFYQDNAPAHKSVVAMASVRDWHWTGWSPSIFSWFGTIWPFSVLQHGKQYWTNEEEICAVEDSFEDQDESFNLYHRNPSGSVWTAGKTMLKNKPHLVKSDHCITVTLWTFQPTLVWNFTYNWFCLLVWHSGPDSEWEMPDLVGCGAWGEALRHLSPELWPAGQRVEEEAHIMGGENRGCTPLQLYK